MDGSSKRGERTRVDELRNGLAESVDLFLDARYLSIDPRTPSDQLLGSRLRI
jgi:hypothetical protein